MQNETVARRYATAVFNLARDAGGVEAVGRDLTTAANAIDSTDDVRRFYLSPVFGRKRKEDVLLGVFQGKLGDIALHTLLLLVRKRREALLQPIVHEYAKLALAAAGKEPLEVVSARDLAPNELNTIVVRLSRQYGKAFDVTQRTDPSLLGGVRITMGDRRIDGSLAGRLDELSRELFARN
ncbi:MAG: ATP synthase F1 subunit delta [Candidatus Eremiobacteraeota bacterium]|nr:ATP synthase F1 subunit delta [Candidatus Eremiobacteraeota bacterium]